MRRETTESRLDMLNADTAHRQPTGATTLQSGHSALRDTDDTRSARVRVWPLRRSSNRRDIRRSTDAAWEARSRTTHDNANSDQSVTSSSVYGASWPPPHSLDWNTPGDTGAIPTPAGTMRRRCGRDDSGERGDSASDESSDDDSKSLTTSTSYEHFFAFLNEAHDLGYRISSPEQSACGRDGKRTMRFERPSYSQSLVNDTLFAECYRRFHDRRRAAKALRKQFGVAIDTNATAPAHLPPQS